MKDKKLNAVIDRIAAIRLEQKVLTAEYEQCLAELEADAEQKLADTKKKSVVYTSENGNSVLFTNADTITVANGELLEGIFGELSSSMYGTETKYSLKSPAKRILNTVWNGEYCEGSVSGIISSLPCDDGIKKVLYRKIKGTDFEKDKSTLMNVAGLDESDASDTAWLIYEAAAWENLCRFADNAHGEEVSVEFLNKIIRKIGNAVNITRSTRVKVIVAGEET